MSTIIENVRIRNSGVKGSLFLSKRRGDFQRPSQLPKYGERVE